MKKYGMLLVGMLLIVGALSLREWLLVKEISLTQNEVREQMVTSIQTAQTTERVRHLNLSSIVYERCLEPVFQIISRLLWSPFRSTMMSEWKREVHTKLDDLSAARVAELNEKTSMGISQIKNTEKPSIARLYNILRMSDGNTTSEVCSQTVQEEIKLVKEAGQKKDQEVLTALKAEGITQLKRFEKLIKGMSQAELGQFLKSGRFANEIQQPVLDYVFQIKQEELRRAAWEEFQRKLQGSLSKKSFPMAKIKDHSQRAQKELEKLFETMAEAKTLDLPALPAKPAPANELGESRLIIPESQNPSSPSGVDAGLTADLPSPSDAGNGE